MSQLHARVHRFVTGTRRPDFHTHQYDRRMKRRDGAPLLLYTIQTLLLYHYLVAEFLRVCRSVKPETFWAWNEDTQARAVWTELFVKRTPISEATQGVITVLGALGINAVGLSYDQLLKAFPKRAPEEWIDWTLDRAGIDYLYMTNDPLDPDEGHNWLTGFERDRRFRAVLRFDSAVLDLADAAPKMHALGYKVTGGCDPAALEEYRRYFTEWTERLQAEYWAISLPPTFLYDTTSPTSILLREVVFPRAAELGKPVALMIGVRRRVNPALRDAGDSSGHFDIKQLEKIAKEFPELLLYVTLLHRDNQHELCVAARKFRNIIPFGTWWFLNNPELQREMTAMRLEMLGSTFIPWHSDGRHLLHGLYKRLHFDEILVDVLTAKYRALEGRGFAVSDEAIAGDLHAMTYGLMPTELAEAAA